MADTDTTTLTEPQAATLAAPGVVARAAPTTPAQDPSQTATGSETGAAGASGADSIAVDDVLEALANVIDPELGLDFVELGLIYGVDVDGGNVKITFSLTTPSCPIGPHVTEQIEEFVGEVDGVESIETDMVFSPPWTPERMSEDAKFALGF